MKLLYPLVHDCSWAHDDGRTQADIPATTHTVQRCLISKLQLRWATGEIRVHLTLDNLSKFHKQILVIISIPNYRKLGLFPMSGKRKCAFIS